jgi:hypothetical protein
MSGAGLLAHAERTISDVAILGQGCTEPRAGARGKLSTVSVDNFAEKISGAQDSCGIRGDSVICLKNRQFFKPLKTQGRFLTSWQTLGISGLFVTGL